MLTGRRAFAGETVSDTIAKILEREPDWTALPPTAGRDCATAPPMPREGCRKRLRDIGDARIALDEVLATGSSGASAAYSPSPTLTDAKPRAGSASLAWSVAALAAALAVVATAFPNLLHRTQRPVATRTTVTSPVGMALSTIPTDAAISPDGTLLVFAASDSADKSRLWLRPLASLDARPIEGTEFSGNESPGLAFWSPDSKTVGFFADDKLKTVGITGGNPAILASVSNARGGTWNRDGVILFAPSSQGPLYRVKQSGGDAVAVTTLDTARHETAHRFPHFFPTAATMCS